MMQANLFHIGENFESDGTSEVKGNDSVVLEPFLSMGRVEVVEEMNIFCWNV